MLSQWEEKQSWWRCKRQMNPIIKSTLVLQWATGLAMEAKEQKKKHNIEKTGELLKQGKRPNEIAEQLGVKEGTIKNYIKEIRGKVVEKPEEVEEKEKQPRVPLREAIKYIIILPLECLILLPLTVLLVVVKVLKLMGLCKTKEGT